MSSTLCNSVSSRRPSLANLYNNLKAQSDPYEELENAARLFPIDDEDEVEETYSAPSASSSSSPSPRFDKNDEESDSESDSSDSDSDVEPMDLNTDAYGSDSVLIHYDTPYMPPRQQSPRITNPRETTLPHKPLPRRPPPRVAPSPPFYRSRQRPSARPSRADEESDRDADCESTGDATDDEYVPSPSLNPRKRSRSSSPASFRRTPGSPAASFSSSSSSEHPNKRARIPPPSRNKQASHAEIQRVEDFEDFVCSVCGWVQKNGRLPDFKRHLKTHQRAFEEGWRCKGVPVSEAADYGVSADVPTYNFLDQERVGGCMKTFSRRDALKRHLDNANVTCVGRPTAATEK